MENLNYFSEKKNHWTYQRVDDNGSYIIECNLCEHVIRREIPTQNIRCIVNTYGIKTQQMQELRPYEAAIYEVISVKNS